MHKKCHEKPPLLESIAAYLKDHPETHISIEGHTDAAGEPKTNQNLSLARAQRVRQALIQRDISAKRMSSVGRGQDDPIDSNETEAGRARNRRVEILITKQ